MKSIRCRRALTSSAAEKPFGVHKVLPKYYSLHREILLVDSFTSSANVRFISNLRNKCTNLKLFSEWEFRSALCTIIVPLLFRLRAPMGALTQRSLMFSGFSYAEVQPTVPNLFTLLLDYKRLIDYFLSE